MKFGILVSNIRFEEKKVFESCRGRKVEFERIDDRNIILDYRSKISDYDLVFDRSISHIRSLQCLKIFDGWGIKTINNWTVSNVCGDKSLMTSNLSANGIPMPRTVIAFSPESALKAIEEVGYPAVLKPTVGSWGRLVSKINDRESAEGIIEHKFVLGRHHHTSFYIQEYIKKPGRDIRVLVIGDAAAGAIYRKSEHWITNARRGSEAEVCPLTDEIREIALKSSRAVGGGILGIDLVEHNGGYLVFEINDTPEFRLFMETTGIDAAGMMVDYAMEVAEK